jgi:phosphoribosylformylglycinamidine synthase I
MARPKALLVAARGTNRDRDMALALTLAGADPAIHAMNEIAADPSLIARAQLVVLPGGFSYGDDLGAGRLWALELRARFGAALDAHVAAGRPLLGVCNGFQALVKAGLLTVDAAPATAVTAGDAGVDGGAAADAGRDANADAADLGPTQRVSLARNANARFECRWVWLERDARCASPWLEGLEGGRVHCPIAHGEGRLVASEGDLDALEVNGQVALRYAVGGGAAGADVPYPHNPNGSARAIAGICNAAGNVLGLMPHPENHVSPLQQPDRHGGGRSAPGLPLFVAGVRYAANA